MHAVQKVVSEHDIDNIFCACQDGDDLTVFAYITRDLVTQKHYCHVFRVDSTVCPPVCLAFSFIVVVILQFWIIALESVYKVHGVPSAMS